MGYYITHSRGGLYMPAMGKLEILVKEGGTIIDNPTEFLDNMVCVVDEEGWQAAAYCWSPEMFSYYSQDDGRKKTWLIVPDAGTRSGYYKKVLEHMIPKHKG